MNCEANNDDDVLAELVGKAGAPDVSPDPHYAAELRATILDRVASALPPATAVAGRCDDTISWDGSSTGVPTESACLIPDNHNADVVPLSTVKGTRNMKRIVRLAVAGSILVAVGVFACSIIGGSSNVAFAQVAQALESLRSATFDMTITVRDYMGREEEDGNLKPPTVMTAKGYFLAPSLQRMEMGANGSESTSIMIMDEKAGKGLMLAPNQKLAITLDAQELARDKKSSPNMFETARQLVREANSTGVKAESLGTKEIDGRTAVGFRVQSNMQDMTLWVDPETARPIRIELVSGMSDGGLSNFRYDVDLDPSLFSFEPPAGYTVQAMNVAKPSEEDLIRTLRIVAEHNNGLFPAKFGMNVEVMKALGAAMKPEMEEIRTKYGENTPEGMKATIPLSQKYMQGIMFFGMLKPENDSHYVGASVKLGTPDRPVFWYKPTDAANYRIIYADLTVKELAADEVKKLSGQ
jgi:outer membrane lipoprotein-sorting protein